MKAYIHSTGIISPQDTFENNALPEHFTIFENPLYLKCIAPSYRDYIDPMAGRRMSRLVKLGVCAAKKCLDVDLANRPVGLHSQPPNKEAADKAVIRPVMPDAIVAGTGLGCMEDTDKFLTSLIQNKEQLLNPSPFIQSTHNTLAATIAMALSCHNYNSTYVHRGFSFENALLDALLMISDHPESNVLTGGLDEITDHYYAITKRLGLYKRNPVSNDSLIPSDSQGTLPGEGASFFLLGGKINPTSFARIDALETFQRPEGASMIEEKINDVISATGQKGSWPDLVIFGLNGDRENDGIYKHLQKSIFGATNCAYYKHLCGEYDTSSAFGMAVAAFILRDQHVPEYMRLKPFRPCALNSILIYNHVRGVNHSIMALSKC